MTKRPPALSRHAVTAPTDEQDLGERINEARRLRIDLVRPNPWQPRQHADPERLAELTEDVRARGVLEPVLVRPISDESDGGKAKYEVVAGERRFRAALAAGLKHIPAIVRKDMTDAEAREASLVENLLREDLDIEDEARFLKYLYDEKGSLRSVGDAIHKSYQYVNRRIKLLERPRALLAYREGLINLDYLIEHFTRDVVNEAELLEGIGVEQSNSSIEEAYAYVNEHEKKKEPEMQEVRFMATRSSFKPFHKLQMHVRKLQGGMAANLPTEDKPLLKQTIHELIEELARLEQSLED